jgi:DNA polymerase-3 subunit alpha
MTQKQPFCHLHGHSHYSLRDGLGRVEEIVETAKNLGMESICLTDHGSAAGWFDLAQACKKHSIKPLHGCELYITDDRLRHGITDEEQKEFKDKHGKAMSKDEKAALNKERGTSYHMVAHAMNEAGVRNLNHIITDANVNGFYRNPRTDWEFMRQHSEGIYVTTACLGGVLAKPLIRKLTNGDEKVAAPDEQTFQKHLALLQDIFPDRFALELQPNDMEDQKPVNQRLVQEARRIGAPIVLTQDFHYPKQEDFTAHEHVKMMCFDIKAKDWDSWSKYHYYLCDYHGIWESWCKNGHNDLLGGDVFAEACANTKMIESMLNPVVDYTSRKVPKFPIPDGFATSEDYLDHLVNEGWKQRYYQMGRGPYVHTRDQYWAQLCHEINIIKGMGFVDYFLIVQDFVMHAKRSGWAVGPARGSAGGCMLSWLIGITEIDPLRFKLVFERFLNPERVKMPDIDSDFSDIDRHKVKEYLLQKWGAENCASIVAYSRYSSKGVLNDISKVYDINYKDTMKVTKRLDPESSVSEEMRSDPKLADFLSKNKLVPLVPVIERLNGMIRHKSVAAAGMLISDQPIYMQTTLQRKGGDGGDIVTEIEGDKLGDAGFLKMDVLGIRELSSLKLTCEKIGKSLDWLYEEVAAEMADPKVWERFQAGDTLAVFQFGSEGMKRLLRNVKPDGIMELAAVSALYRPQTLMSGVADSYWKRKHGQENIVSIHPLVDPIFKDTYGLQVFQEQFIAAFVELGLSYGEADIMRRAYEDVVKIHKRAKAQANIDKFMAKLKQANKLPADELERVATILGGEVGYSFNVAHSVAYSMLAYFGQYLKVNHPKEYWVSVMNTEMNHTKSGKKIQMDPFINRLDSLYRSERKNMVVYAGSINSFSKHFAVHEDGTGTPWMFYGLLGVNGIGEPTVDALMEYVQSHGKPFAYVKEFFEHGNGKFGKGINTKHLRIMIEIGMFDNMAMSAEYPYALNRAQLSEWYGIWHDVKSSKIKRSAMYEPGKIAVKRAVGKGKDKVEVFVETIDPSIECDTTDIQAFEMTHLDTIITNNIMRRYVAEAEFMKNSLENNPKLADKSLICGMLIDAELDQEKGRTTLVVHTIDQGKIEVTVWEKKFKKQNLELNVGQVYSFICNQKGKFYDLERAVTLTAERPVYN